jgi:GrpB-like predicted nucleotidyltransferase (UPF0157 family)
MDAAIARVAAESVKLGLLGAPGGWERDHLVFRDYLRAHPARRNAYQELKLRLAAVHRGDQIAYTDAKDEFVRSTLVVAAEWAPSQGWAP